MTIKKPLSLSIQMDLEPGNDVTETYSHNIGSWAETAQLVVDKKNKTLNVRGQEIGSGVFPTKDNYKMELLWGFPTSLQYPGTFRITYDMPDVLSKLALPAATEISAYIYAAGMETLQSLTLDVSECLTDAAIRNPLFVYDAQKQLLKCAVAAVGKALKRGLRFSVTAVFGPVMARSDLTYQTYGEVVARGYRSITLPVGIERLSGDEPCSSDESDDLEHLSDTSSIFIGEGSLV